MVIDFHSHILPGMDDGAKDLKTALEMLDMAASQGVDVQLLTPHFYPWDEDMTSYCARREASFRELRQACGGPLPTFYLGAETAFFPHISRADLSPLCLGESDLLLLEMPMEPWDDRVMDELASLVLDRDYRVILAHVERYLPFRGNEKKLIELSALDMFMQINSGSIISPATRRKTLRLAEKLDKLVLGSDAHNCKSRVPDLRQGREIVKKSLGAEKLRRIDETGEALLQRIRT